MHSKDNFLICLEKARYLDSQGMGEAASAMLCEAEYWLDKIHETTFRSYIRSNLMNTHARDVNLNPDNPLFLHEIANESFLKTYGRRETVLSQHLERTIEDARAIHAIHEANRMQAAGESAKASRLILATIRRDSLSGPLLESFWQRIQEMPPATEGNPLYARMSIESIDSPPALHKGFSLAVSSDRRLVVAKDSGGIEVFDLQGKHLSSHLFPLSYPFSCSGSEGKTWFASGGTVACLEPESEPTIRFHLHEGRDYPREASFTSLSYGAGLLWYSYFCDSEGKYIGTLLGMDPASGEVRIRHNLGECFPIAAANGTSAIILDTFSCRAFRANNGNAGLFSFDQQLTASRPKHILRMANQILIADTTTLLLFSHQGTLLGRLRPGQSSGHLTDISGIAASQDGKTIFAMDFYTKRLFRIAVETIHSPGINRDAS